MQFQLTYGNFIFFPIMPTCVRNVRVQKWNVQFKINVRIYNTSSKPMYRVVCPNFGRPVLTLSFTKYKLFQVKNCFATIMHGLSALKLFQLSNGNLLFSQHAYIYSIYKVCKPRLTKLGQGVEVRARYLMYHNFSNPNLWEKKNNLVIIPDPRWWKGN